LSYTGLRIVLFAASVAIVGGIWLVTTGSPRMWVLIISLVIMGWRRTLLGRQRGPAQHVDDAPGAPRRVRGDEGQGGR
jgi:hypothetical protein